MIQSQWIQLIMTNSCVSKHRDSSNRIENWCYSMQLFYSNMIISSTASYYQNQLINIRSDTKCCMILINILKCNRYLLDGIAIFDVEAMIDDWFPLWCCLAMDLFTQRKLIMLVFCSLVMWIVFTLSTSKGKSLYIHIMYFHQIQ